MKIIFYLLIILPVSLCAQTNSCKEIRLDSPGMPLENIPIHDQDGLNLCEHYVAAQIIDANRFYENGKKFDGHISSPIALSAMLTSRIKSFTTLEGLLAEDIVRLSHKVGTCNDETLIARLAESDKVNFCEELKYALSKIRPNKYNSAAANPNATNTCSVRKDEKFGGYQGIDLIAEFLGSNKDLKNIAEEIKKVCSGKIQTPAKILTNSLLGSENKFSNSAEKAKRFSKYKNLINSALDSPKPMPVGLRYCSYVLSKDRISSLDGQTGYVSNCTDKGINGTHASIIIGRRPSKSGNGCQYLVRNSYGVSCNEYSSRWECDKTKGGKPCPAGTQCGGQVWVDEEDLLNNTQEVFTAEAP